MFFFFFFCAKLRSGASSVEVSLRRFGSRGGTVSCVVLSVDGMGPSIVTSPLPASRAHYHLKKKQLEKITSVIVYRV